MIGLIVLPSNVQFEVLRADGIGFIQLRQAGSSSGKSCVSSITLLNAVSPRYGSPFNGVWSMKIVETVVLLSRGAFAQSNEWVAIRNTVHAAIAQAEWPIGAGDFIIHPQSGKKSGEGNGVVPIKAKPMAVLKDDGWALEYPWEVATKAGVTGRGKGSKPGNIDAAKLFPEGLVVVEWETGNISSSHRAINKMALGLVAKKCVAGILVIPNMKLETRKNRVISGEAG